MPDWSPQQNEALSVAGAWLRVRYKPSFYLAGYAGTGKTTLAMHIAQHEKGKVAFAAFTGKAARVMRDKGCKGARTIHSLIYHTEADPVTGNLTITLDRFALDGYSLVVIDEVSMVNEKIGADLLSFGVPILVLGDPAQLPPIEGAGFFTSGKPDYMLTEIHRQAADSAIVRLATAIREGHAYGQPIETDGLTVCSRKNLDPRLVTTADSVVVGRNATRQAYNARLRERRGFLEPAPQPGEPLICLRNDQLLNVWNGEIYTIRKKGRSSNDAHGRIYRFHMVDPDDDARQPVPVKVRGQFFESDDAAAKALPFKSLRGFQHFTYGYCLTGHKAQGSQWPKVCVFDESAAFREDARRWAYTAVTRAAQHLTLVI